MEKAASQPMGGDLSPRPSVLKTKAKVEQSKTRSSHRSSVQQSAVRFKRRDADEVIPTESFRTSMIDEPVRLLQSSDPPEIAATYDLVPITVMTALRQRAMLSPNHIALASKIGNSWQNISFKEYYERVQTMAKAFIRLGLERCHGVAILGHNCPEWFIANLAAIFAGGVSVAMNTRYTAEACQRVAYDSKCNIFLASSDVQCSRILLVKEKLPHLKAIVQFPTSSSARSIPEVHTWQQLIEIGEKCSDDTLQNRILQQAPNLCCTLLYKPAPGGEHRGVMLSHDNLLWTALIVGRQLEVRYDRGRIVSILPLISAYSQVFEIYVPIVFGSTVHFVTTPDAVKDSLLEALKEVRPTLLMSIPSLYDRMFEKLSMDFKNETWLKHKLTLWATHLSKRMHSPQYRGRRRPLCFCLANALVYGPVRRRLGLDQAKMCLATGAPISAKTFLFFVSLNIPILEIYGLAESSGFHTLSLPRKFRFKSAGHEIPGCYVDISNKDQYDIGQVRLKGRNVFMGYLKDPHETMQAFDEGEWFQTGDTGMKDSDGFLFITGRIRDILITDSGDKVAPKPIEDAVKAKLSCVSHCILVGEGRKHLTLLLTLKTDLQGYTLEPSQQLAAPTLEWLRKLGCSGPVTVSDVRVDTNQKMKKAFQEVIDLVNSRATSKSERIEQWAILPKDFSVMGGELDAPDKINRRIVTEKYSQFIDTLYPDKAPTN